MLSVLQSLRQAPSAPRPEPSVAVSRPKHGSAESTLRRRQYHQPRRKTVGQWSGQDNRQRSQRWLRAWGSACKGGGMHETLHNVLQAATARQFLQNQIA